MPFLILQSLGVPELLIILAILIVLFGASRIVDVGAAMGRAIRQFRRELRAPDSDEDAGEQT
jgi:sec-independent protein translocase protein TatA